MYTEICAFGMVSTHSSTVQGHAEICLRLGESTTQFKDMDKYVSELVSTCQTEITLTERYNHFC